MVESLVVPLMEKMEDWKKNLIVMDREHARGEHDENFTYDDPVENHDQERQ